MDFSVNMASYDPVSIELEQEDDGRWIAEIAALSGALSYGSTKEEATRKVEALALRILADRVGSGGRLTRDCG